MDVFNIPLVSWVNGTILIGVFVVVVIGLIITVFLLMNNDKKASK